MNTASKKRPMPDAGDPREMAKWSRRYAQNRSLGVVFLIVVSVLLCVAIGGSSLLAGHAARSGNTPMLVLGAILMFASFAVLLYLANPWWGGKAMERLAGRLYASEGNVATTGCLESRLPWAFLLGVCFVSCVLASVFLGFVFEYPIKYMQPISATYVVPFLVCLWFLMRPAAGPLALLWPALYGLHAILIVAGAPIVFTGDWEGLNMLLPMAGYGIIAGLAGHFYSRIALSRLKRLARVAPTAGTQEDEGRPS